MSATRPVSPHERHRRPAQRPPASRERGRRASRLRRLPALPAIGLVRAYQLLLAPLFAGSCKYHPSCSQYALDALRSYGLVRGSVLAGWRLLRCNPWSHGGVDHVDDQALFARRRDARHA